MEQNISPPSSLLSYEDKPTTWLGTAIVKYCNRSLGAEIHREVQSSGQNDAATLPCLLCVEVIAMLLKIRKLFPFRDLNCHPPGLQKKLNVPL